MLLTIKLFFLALIMFFVNSWLFIFGFFFFEHKKNTFVSYQTLLYLIKHFCILLNWYFTFGFSHCFFYLVLDDKMINTAIWDFVFLATSSSDIQTCQNIIFRHSDMPKHYPQTSKVFFFKKTFSINF